MLLFWSLFIDVIDIIAIIVIIGLIFLGWLNAIGSRILYELDHRNPILYMSFQFRVSSVNCLLYQWETLGQFHTTCAATFPGRPATAGRVPAIDAGCGLSNRGHWDGPVICNEAGRRFEHQSCHVAKGSM